METGKVLVLDANQRSALAIIRSLGRHGLSVVAADYVKTAIGSASRFAKSSARYSDPTANPARFLEDISGIVQQFGIEVVIPVTDVTTMLLVSNPKTVAPARLACPSVQSYEALTDKQLLMALAQKLEVPIPETRVASTPQEILDAATALGYPLVLKPGRSRYLKGGRILSTAVRIVGSPAELDATVHRLEWLGDIPCLVQRFIPGHGAGVFAVCGPGGPIAWFAHKRIREKPPSGGVSVLSQSVAPDPLMQTSAERILSAANWFGVAMVEFRIATDGTPYLMEVNGRFWGSLQLAVDCGVDFPWLLYQLEVGKVPLASAPYTTGRRLRWLLGDLDNLLLQLRGSRPGVSGKITASGRFLRTFFDLSCRQEIFRWFDPKPGIREACEWIRAVVR